MRITKITLVILEINALVDAGKNISIEEAFKKIEDHTIFEFLLKKFGNLEGINFLNSFPKDKKDLLDALDRAANTISPGSDFGIENNGLIFLNGLLNQLIQSNVKEIILA